MQWIVIQSFTERLDGVCASFGLFDSYDAAEATRKLYQEHSVQKNHVFHVTSIHTPRTF